jgi:FAD synthetase
MKVMVFGSFDGLHKGHLSYLKQAKKYGDYLIAVVAREDRIMRQKKHQPQFSEPERLAAVKNSSLVNEALLGNENIYEVLKKYQPDVICLGYDQRADVAFLKKNFPAIKIIRLKAYKPEIYKSSKLYRAATIVNPKLN